MRDSDFDIKHPKKKFQKTERVPPEGYSSANEFFEEMYMDKDMIWMGQNTNHLHDDTISDAMIEAIKEKQFCKYPAPEGFSELKQLILDDLQLEDFEVLLTSGATESLYLVMQALLEPEDNVILSDPGYFIIGDFANRFAGEVRYVPIYFEENDYKLTPKLLRENMDENTRMVILIDPLNPLGSSYTEDELKEFAEIAKENDLYLLHDITYKDFAREHFLVENYAPGQTLTIYSFSKIFGMAGMRIGGVISSKPIIDAIKNAFKNLGNFFKNIFNTLKQFVENTGFLDTLKTFGKGLKDALYPIWEAITSFFKGIFATVKEDPIGALKKLLTAFGIVIAILLMLRVGQLMYSASWVLDEFARLVKAFRKNILALRWKALMKSLLYVAASILIITYAIERISKINAVDALKGVAAIVYILLAYMAIIKVLTTSEESKTTSILAGTKTAFAMLGLAAGLSIFISAFAKLLEKIQGYSTTDIVKAGVIFYLIGVLLIGVIAVTFRKLNKEGIFKGEKLKGPGLNFVIYLGFLKNYTLVCRRS